MSISAKQVKALRDVTGAGMMDCKKALLQNDGNIEEAKLWLQKKGIADSRKRADRAASEGRIGAYASSDGRKALLLEVNCETDFVARNEEFIAIVDTLGRLALRHDSPSVAALLETDWEGQTAGERLLERSGKIGERLAVRRLAWLALPEGPPGGIGSYVHSGKIGVIVAATVSGAQDTAKEPFHVLLKDLAMHVAGVDPTPRVVQSSQLDPAEVQRQEEILEAQAAETGKPAEIVSKMVAGRIAKWKKEVALLDQPFVKDGDLTIAKHVASVSQRDLSGPVQVAGFVRFRLGENLET